MEEDNTYTKLTEYAIPNLEGYQTSIQRPTVAANNFELKPALINMVQQEQFGGGVTEDPHAHLAHFLEICDTVKMNGVTEDAVRLRLFPFSLKERAKTEELEEVQHLKKSNDKLLKDVEQLHIDHCSDVEELVYLRWVNTCLRYELRIYQPPQGKTVARDLSKSLSPRSEEKAKKLIVEYANSRVDEKGMSPGDLDDYSSSQTSTGESNDTFMGSIIQPEAQLKQIKVFPQA